MDAALFGSKERLFVYPDGVTLDDARFHVGDVLKLVRPDGMESHATLAAVVRLRSNKPGRSLALEFGTSLTLDMVPIGTTLWALDSAGS